MRPNNFGAGQGKRRDGLKLDSVTKLDRPVEADEFYLSWAT